MIFGKKKELSLPSLFKRGGAKNFLRFGLIAIFCSVIVFILYSIEANIDATASLGLLAPQNYLRHPMHRGAAMTPAAISSWMTFEFLNRVFKMPPQYLQNALQITDTRYPRLTIKTFAAGKRINLVLALTEIKASVTAFLAKQNLPR